MTDKERCRILIEALRPFANFHDGGDVWKNTAWDGKELDDSVLHDYKTGRDVSIRDFWRAGDALRRAISGVSAMIYVFALIGLLAPWGTYLPGEIDFFRWNSGERVSIGRSGLFCDWEHGMHCRHFFGSLAGNDI